MIVRVWVKEGLLVSVLARVGDEVCVELSVPVEEGVNEGVWLEVEL